MKPDTALNTKSALVICLLVALFAAITDFAGGRWLTAAWIAYAGALSLTGARTGTARLVAGSLPVWGAALVRLYFLEARPEGYTLFANERFCLFVLAAAFLAAAYLVQRRKPMHRYMTAFAYAAAFTMIIATLKENADFISDRHYRNLGYSYVLAFYAAVFLAAGFARASRPLRVSGMALAVLVLAKLYLYDIWTMSLLVRIIAGFTLGLALVLLSVFYQKFRDRLFTRGGAALIMVLALLLPASPAEPSAGDFNASGFRYYKELQAPAQTGAPRGPVYGRFLLDDDMARYAGSGDIRVARNGRALPYFTRGVLDDPKQKGALRPVVIFHEADREGGTYVLRLPEPPKGAEFTGIDVKSDGQYEAGVWVSTALEAGQWGGAEHRSLFSYATDKFSTIRFRSGGHRYVRLRFDSRHRFSFPSVQYAPAGRPSEYEADIPVKTLTRDRDPDRDATVYYYENDGRRKIVGLALRFSDARYTRMMEIHVLDPERKSYYYLLTAGLSRRSGDPDLQAVDFPMPVAAPLKLIILDGDNEPLSLFSCKAVIPREELIFELPSPGSNTDGAASSRLRVYYGNPYAEPPRYDISATFDEALGVSSLVPGPHIVNGDFGYSLVEPPLSTWIIRALFIAGLSILAWPVWRILTDYSAAARGRDEEAGEEKSAKKF